LESQITIDSALQNPIPEDYIEKYITIPEVSRVWNRIQKEKTIGMTITELKWHSRYKNDVKLQQRIINSLIETTKYLINKGYKILLIPQLFGESYTKSEEYLIKQIQKVNEREIFVLPLELDSYAQQIIIAKLFCIIGMRYHPNIFALKGSTPFIAITYEHKTDGFVKKLGLTNMMINVQKISSQEMVKRFEYLEKNYESIQSRMQEKGLRLIRESQRTTGIVLEKLRKDGKI